MAFSLPSLSYPYNALEPHIDAATMQIHHTRHHQTYVDKLNAALEKAPDHADKGLEELLGNISALPQEIQTAVKNHGGGHANHSLFWTIIGPPNPQVSQPAGTLASALASAFGSANDFKSKFADTAANHFGSGWAWLVINANKQLELYSLPNQDSPFMQKHTPILGLDVWEHAYYLKYQNKRPDYITAFWNVVNWQEVERLFQKAIV